VNPAFDLSDIEASEIEPSRASDAQYGVPTQPPEAAELSGVRLVMRAAGERLSDPAIGAVYAQGAFLPALGLVVPFHPMFAIDAEVSAWSKKSVDGAALGVVPLSVLVEWTATPEPVSLFVGAGPTFTVFTERRSATPGANIVEGTKLAGEVRAGVRLDTHLIDRPMPPARSSGPGRLEVEIYAARRQQLPRATGFDLSAWRGAFGLALCF
jgi:hypothetical protein